MNSDGVDGDDLAFWNFDTVAEGEAGFGDVLEGAGADWGES